MLRLDNKFIEAVEEYFEKEGIAIVPGFRLYGERISSDIAIESLKKRGPRFPTIYNRIADLYMDEYLEKGKIE